MPIAVAFRDGKNAEVICPCRGNDKELKLDPGHFLLPEMIRPRRAQGKPTQ